MPLWCHKQKRRSHWGLRLGYRIKSSSIDHALTSKGPVLEATRKLFVKSTFCNAGTGPERLRQVRLVHGKRVGLACAVLLFAALFTGVPDNSATAASGSSVIYDSPEDAYKAGRRAMKRGDYRSALAPLQSAADGGVFLAKFYLAELLSDTRHIFADPNRAYMFYSELIDRNPDVDPAYDYRARFVARAYVMKGRYLSGVLPIDGLQRSQSLARRLFGHAATYLDDPDAQFEFARMLLKGRGGARNVRSGKHYLSTLSRKGHAAAQGYLAELFWHGDYVPKREDYALALSTLAVRNARRDDQIWIDELHHEISCQTSAQVHDKAEHLLVRWKKTHPPQRIYPRETADALGNRGAQWTCGSNPNVPVDGQKPALVATDEPEGKEAWPDQDRLEALHGSMFGLGGNIEKERLDSDQ